MKRIIIVLLTVITALTTTPALAENQVLSLDGKGDYVEVPDAESLDLTANFTFEAWVFPTTTSGGNIIFNKEETYQWAIRDGNPQWALKTGGSWAWYDTGIPVLVNQWTHLALTYDSNNVSVYGNGLLLSTIPDPQGGNLEVNDSPLWLGGRSKYSVSFFAGLMDEVRIWNIVRTPEEIKKTMFTTLSGSEPGLVGLWQFDDVDNIATDLSPHHYDGKLQGDAHIIAKQLPKPGDLITLSGMIADETGKPMPNAFVRLEQDGEEIVKTRADASGNYRITLFQPAGGRYDLCATSATSAIEVAGEVDTLGELGAWRMGLQPHPGEPRELNLTLKPAISIEGTLLMLDDKTPHVAVPVQALRNGKVIDGTLSDKEGKYHFINLRPGRYQVRCQVLDGYVYYRTTDDVLRVTLDDSAMREDVGDLLHVKASNSLKGINFRFAPFKKGTWKTYASLDGLAASWVTAIYPAPDGVMWFGTSSGVSRYDGNHFKTFTTKDGLANNRVGAIGSTSDGVMWFGPSWFSVSGDGVSRYDGEEFRNFTTEDGLPSNTVASIYCAPDGVIWFGTGTSGEPGGGISRYDGREFVNFTTEEVSAASYGVNDIYRAPDGTMWFATWGGVLRYDGKEFKNFTTKDGLADNSVIDIYRTPDGVMWFGTWGGGVSRYDGEEFRNFTTKDGLLTNWVLAIHSDPDGTLWFGTVESGVSRYDGKTFVNFTTEDGLPHGLVDAIGSDPNGVMWFGTYRGVSRYSGKDFQNFTTKDGLADNEVVSVYRAPDDVWWFGTEGGVSRYDGKRFVNFTTQDGLVNNRVHAIHRGADGMMWFGTRFGGISRYDGNQFKNFTTKDGLAGNQIFAVHCETDGVMWFGTLGGVGGGGVSRYDGNQFNSFTTKDGLANNGVYAIYSTPDGVIWFGTSRGVSRYDGNQFLNFPEKDGLANNWVWSIHRDPDGVMWFGTTDGVSSYDGKTFVNFTPEEGLAANFVYSIYRDLDGTMWFGTQGGGVSGYDGQAWTSLDMRDGLVGNHIHWIEQDENGSLWFGAGDGGITRYRKSTTKPKVHIVSVKTDKEYTDFEALPSITTGRRVTIRYSSIDYKTVPEKRQYRYRITELDSDWRRPTRETFFDDSFDKPGEYTFLVQAIDRDLNYSEPASLTLKVVPPFYMRVGFLLPTLGFGAIIIAVLIIVSVGYFKRRRQVQAYQQAAVEELQDANRVQMMLMPDKAPQIEGLEIAGKCLPANTVSGDFFDYLVGKGDNEIGLVVADVCGKAMKGAMNAIMTNGILHSVAKDMEKLAPASLMMGLNEVLKSRMEQYMNVTMVIGVIHRNRVFGKNSVSAENSVSGGEITLTLANAAHHAHPLLLRDNDIQVLKTGGLPLGMRVGVEYSEEQILLQTGDVLFLMTDGIIEAQDSEGQMYSDSGRLDKTISKFTLDLSAEAMVEAIINDAIDFGGDKTTRDDDMTVVVAKIK